MKRWAWLVVLLVLLPYQWVRAAADTLFPDGIGNYDQFAAWPVCDKWLIVNNIEEDDSVLYEAAVGEQQSLTLEAFSGNGTVDSVVLHYRAKQEDEGAAHTVEFTPFLRLGATDLDGTPNAIDSTVFANFSEAIGRPGGGTWTVADIATLEVGMTYSDEIDAGAGAPLGDIAHLYVVVWYTPTPTQVIPVQ